MTLRASASLRETHPFSLSGKRILITGASSGIGRSCAVEFSKLGAECILAARREPQLNETLASLQGSGHRVETFDFLNTPEIGDWLKSLASAAGRLDGLIHAAGISMILPLRATSVADFRKIMTTNVEAGFFLAKGFRQKDVRGTFPSLVMVGSVMSLVGQPALAAYAASKGALVTMVKSLALELARESIRVNMVAPGQVRTAMADAAENIIPEESLNAIESNHPLGLGRPEDVAYAAAYLMSDAARWVTGSVLTVDGGYTAA